jgi:hypothetical protein
VERRTVHKNLVRIPGGVFPHFLQNNDETFSAKISQSPLIARFEIFFERCNKHLCSVKAVNTSRHKKNTVKVTFCQRLMAQPAYSSDKNSIVIKMSVGHWWNDNDMRNPKYS